MAADDHVVLKLAHPLTAEQATHVNAEPKQYGVGDDLVVPASTAMTVINAGYAQVDPADAKAVAAVLAARRHEDDSAPAAGSTQTPAPAPTQTPAPAAGASAPAQTAAGASAPAQTVPKPPATP